MSDVWVFEHIPPAQHALRVFREVLMDTGFDVVEFTGEPGCLRAATARIAAGLLGRQVVEFKWADIRVRPDKVLNRLATPPVNQQRRCVILRFQGAYTVKDIMRSLLTYTEHNQFIAITEDRADLGEHVFEFYPLGETAIKTFLRRASKKTKWRFNYDMVRPIARFTGGKPTLLVSFIQTTLHATTPKKALNMITNTSEHAAAQKVFESLISGCSSVELTATLRKALDSAGWKRLADLISEMLVEDVLNTDDEQLLLEMAPAVLGKFSPHNKADFVAKCLEAHALILRATQQDRR